MFCPVAMELLLPGVAPGRCGGGGEVSLLFRHLFQDVSHYTVKKYSQLRRVGVSQGVSQGVIWLSAV